LHRDVVELVVHPCRRQLPPLLAVAIGPFVPDHAVQRLQLTAISGGVAETGQHGNVRRRALLHRRLQHLVDRGGADVVDLDAGLLLEHVEHPADRLFFRARP
jgi:hypothetical protein